MKKKLIVLVLVAVMIIGCVPVSAKEITIPVPKISVKATKGEKGIKITIKKTKDAEGYELFLAFKSDECLYKDDDIVYCHDNLSFDFGFTPFKKVELSGDKKRTVTINAEEIFDSHCKSLPIGKYMVKAKSYNVKKYGAELCSEFSTQKSLTIKSKETGLGYKSSYDFSNVNKGDVIKFGAYEQDACFVNGQEPIEWVVLDKTKSKILVLSKNILDRFPYHYHYDGVTWETCSLRKWLNSIFFNSAFNQTEKGMIKVTTVENYDNVEYNSLAGNDTKDKLFLLSQLEMINTDYGFADAYMKYDDNRKCSVSDYFHIRISEWYFKYSSYRTKDGEFSCSWWLRTPGQSNAQACCVGREGCVFSSGSTVFENVGHDFGNLGVRPAMWISIKSKK